MKALPSHAYSVAHAADEFRKMSNHVELIEVHAFPWNLRVLIERRLSFLAESIYGRVDLLERSALGVSDDSRPGLIRLPNGNGISMTRTAVSAESFVRHLSYMRTSHHHQDTLSTHSVRLAVGFGGHTGHRPDPHHCHFIFPNVINNT